MSADQAPIESPKVSGHGVRVPVALPPGAPTLLGSPSTGGFAWAAGFNTTAAAIVALIRRALSVGETDQ